MDDEFSFDRFKDKKNHKSIPLGLAIIGVALLIFSIYYFIAYTPGISGWSQEKAYEESLR
jgi:hypothetical protein